MVRLPRADRMSLPRRVVVGRCRFLPLAFAQAGELFASFELCLFSSSLLAVSADVLVLVKARRLLSQGSEIPRRSSASPFEPLLALADVGAVRGDDG